MTVMPVTSHRLAALQIARTQGVARWRDFAAAGIAPSMLGRLVKQGALVRIGRGLYQAADAEPSEHQSLIEAAKAVPHGVIALLSALRLHDLTTQLPQVVWMLIDGKARAPASPPVRIRILRASGPALSAGAQRRTIDGVQLLVTSPAKTVADCFKYRSRVGVDVALEALKDGLARKAFTPSEFLAMAAIDRVARLARPYLEALV